MELLYADRSARGKLRVTGPQAAWFLDQVLTQKVDDMAPGEARDAAMITVHGRMTAYLEALRTEDGFLCHYEPDLRASFPDDLARYVFATRVELQDVTDDHGLLLVAGDGWEEASAPVPGALVHPTRALGEPAAYLWVERSAVAGARARLEERGFRRVEEPELERIRIANGIPRWGHDMDVKTLPQEIGVDARAVHYDKGCYLGQEAMAKIHFRGKVNRRLTRLETAEPVSPGADVRDADARVGRVTSATGTHALAVLKGTVEAGTLVTVGGIEAKVVS